DLRARAREQQQQKPEALADYTLALARDPGTGDDRHAVARLTEELRPKKPAKAEKGKAGKDKARTAHETPEAAKQDAAKDMAAKNPAPPAERTTEASTEDQPPSAPTVSAAATPLPPQRAEATGSTARPATRAPIGTPAVRAPRAVENIRNEPPRTIRTRPETTRGHAAPTRLQASPRAVTRTPNRPIVRATTANDRRLFEIERQRRRHDGPRFSDAFSDQPIRR
ncbi:MAG: hypothetical protein AB7U62_18705, partial [Pseudolabrys sp.]